MNDNAPSVFPPSYVPYPARKSGTNGFAVAALVAALLFPLAGVALGHIALSQIKRTGEGGRALAVAGLVVGYVYIALAVSLLIIGVVVATSSGYPTG